MNIVSRVTVHEDFYAGNLQNDIAMLELKYPLDFSLMPHIGSICLPPNKLPIYSDCRVTGWGQQVSTGEVSPFIMFHRFSNIQITIPGFRSRWILILLVI